MRRFESYWGHLFRTNFRVPELQRTSLTCSPTTKRASPLPIPARSATGLSNGAGHSTAKATACRTVSIAGISGQSMARGGCPLGDRGSVPAQPPRDCVMAAAACAAVGAPLGLAGARSLRAVAGLQSGMRTRGDGLVINVTGVMPWHSARGRAWLGCTPLRPAIVVSSVGRTAAGGRGGGCAWLPGCASGKAPVNEDLVLPVIHAAAFHDRWLDNGRKSAT